MTERRDGPGAAPQPAARPQPAATPQPVATPVDDPLEGDPRLAELFADRLPAVRRFRDLLLAEGEERGLIGPRERGRLWERHLINSAAVVPFLPPGTVADVGSGAGLPGLIIASMCPDREVIAIEPMERRVAWLEDASSRLGLANVRVLRGRAEVLAGVVRVPAVTARAVAAVGKIAGWCRPLLAPGGEMVLLKGRSARDEVASAAGALRRLKLTAEVLEAPTLPGLEPTTVVRLRDARE